MTTKKRKKKKEYTFLNQRFLSHFFWNSFEMLFHYSELLKILPHLIKTESTDFSFVIIKVPRPY